MVLYIIVAADGTIRFKLDGRDRECRGDPRRSLLRWLRDEAGIVTAKDGCSPQAACGCCAVHLNGKPVLSCVTSLGRVAGGSVTTLAGLEPNVREAFAESFAGHGGAQCGFCIPGIVMRAAALLRLTPQPSREEVAQGLHQHLCRCTGYKKIIDSILAAGRVLLNGKPEGASPQNGKVGTRSPKYAVRAAVLGERPYVADMDIPGMLHAALKLSDHPRAKVLAVEVAQAARAPGVERVLVARDVPGERVIGLITADWPVLVAEGETTSCVGDVLAVVVARTRDEARAAARLVRVEYEVLRPVTTLEEALAPGAPRLRPGGNILSVSKAKKGDAGRAFQGCKHVVEQVYTTQVVEHAYMEPEACLAAAPDGGGLLVYSQGQGIYEDRRQIAGVLGLPEDKVRVVQVPNGGGFGGKEDLVVGGQAALAAWLLRRPVKLELSRDESILMHPKRHGLRLEYKLGCDARGRLLALRVRIFGDSGAHASVGAKVLERACGHAAGAYDVPNVDIESTAIYTNNPPCGAMRGFGANQATFAMESAVDELCALGGFDRWRLRWDNALTEGKSTATGQVLAAGVGVRACLEAVEGEFRQARWAGLACGIKNTGIGNGMPDFSEAKIVVRSSREIELCHGWTEMGQGVETMAAQVFCTETGLPPSLVKVRMDTADGAPAGMTTASRATSLVGNALLDACRAFKADLARSGLAAMAGRTYRGRWVCDWTNQPGCDTGGRPVCTHYSYSYAAQVAVLDEDGDVSKLIAAHDAGKVINPMLFEGQIEGSLHMGLGYALTEELELDGGRPKSTRLRDMGVLRARETPELQVIGVEVPDPYGPYGAKGVGEIGLVPTAAAVANALFQFDGARRRSLPMKRKRAR